MITPFKFFMANFIFIVTVAAPAFADVPELSSAIQEQLGEKIKNSSGRASTMSDADFFSLLNNVAEYKEINEKIERLKQKSAEAKAREQSAANKILGAAAIGAAGIGGMNYFQGAAEKKADEDAAGDIAAYISTMTCEISGRGGKIRRGETGAAPGFSNPAMAVELKSEYIRIADKTRSAKENLGMPAGIESDLIVDKSSLYDYGENGAMGKTANRFDIAEQRLASGEAASKMNTGAKVAGAGILGGIVGNLAVNEIFPKLGQGNIEKHGGKKAPPPEEPLKK
ncbi:MAG: hypothetical protein LBK26_03105 [Rickettsiales bacterium]|nr:hypothetical protein [Rickettsiales bacterium]